MTEAQKVLFDEWLQGRPKIVQEMALKYPPGTRFLMHGEIVHVMSFEENGGLSVTPIDPNVDYYRAVEFRGPVCACCVTKLDELKIV